MNTRRIAAFIRRHWEPAQSWDRSDLVKWIDWFIDDNRLVSVRCNNKLVGLCMGRVLPAPEAHVDHYIHNEYGGLLWIDLFISKDKNVARVIRDAFLKRFGRLEAVGFRRDERDFKEPRFHDFNRLERRFRDGI